MNVKEFMELHPGEPMPFGQVDWILPDGARWCGDGDGIRSLVTFIDPPRDPIANKRARIHYLDAAIDYHVGLFTKYKSDCDQQDHNHLQAPSLCPPAPPDANDKLAELAKKIADFRERKAELETDSVDPRREEADRTERLRQQENRDRVMAAMNERMSISI